MDLPKRKSPRLKGYDYSTPGYYFITVCTKNKKCILGRIVEKNPTLVGEGLCALPTVSLTQIGKSVEASIKKTNSLYSHISIDKYVIMPNHIHLIIIKHPTNNKVSGGLGDPPLPYSKTGVDDMVARLKSYTTHQYGKSLWQRSFHDHIIRGEKDYLRIWEYIDTNPAKWEQDCFYTE